MSDDTLSLSVREVWIYPVKSMSGISCTDATVTRRGFTNDRRWMVITDQGNFVTQRQIPAMAAIRVFLNDSTLRLQADNVDPCVINIHPGPQGASEDVIIHGLKAQGIRESTEVSEWLTTVLGTYKGSTLALVRFPDDYRRSVDPEVLGPDQAYTEFADQYPFLVISEASLAALNEKLLERGKVPVPMTRFRPNIVVEGCQAFEEDTLSLLHCAGGSVLELVKPCARCPVTTVDQITGVKPDPREPLATLASFRRHEKGVIFGQNAIVHTAVDTIAVGEEIQAHRR